MSWASKSPPQSPRGAPKIQQQSWEDSTSPPVNLYDPTNDYYTDRGQSTSTSAAQQCRKVNYSQQNLPYLMSPKLQRKFGFGGAAAPVSLPPSPRHHAKFDFVQTSSAEMSSSPSAKARNSKPKRPYNVSPDGVCSLDEYTRTITYNDTTTPANTKRKMSITVSDGDSLLKQTELSSNSTMSLSTSACMSLSTTATYSAGAANNPLESHELRQIYTKVLMSGESVDEDDGGHPTDSSDAFASGLNRRRHAINITPNPGYQKLHNSHSTLDRTCSDSVVSLIKYRKSTSDLTANDEYGQSMTPISRRRGSKGGGLAFLASRRGSRESVVSQQTNFSNEEIGPLNKFQATQRGRQRRTSNFLELPSE